MLDQLQHLLTGAQPELDAVQSDFASAHAKYSLLRDDAVSAVRTWEWSSSLPRYHLDPLFFLNSDLKRGRPLRVAPIPVLDHHEYGFDATGRLVIGREHTEFDGQFYEEFFVYRPSDVTSYVFTYSSDKAPVNCSRLRFLNEVPASFHVQARFGQQSHVYIPNGTKIRYFCSVHNQQERKHSFGSLGELAFDEPGKVELWLGLSASDRILEFSGKATCYNTVLDAPCSSA